MNRKDLIKKAIIAGAGVAIGYTVGYYVTRKRLIARFVQEVEDYKDSLRIIRNQEYDTPGEAVEVLIKGEDVDRPLTETEKQTLDDFIEEHAYGQPGDPQEDLIEPAPIEQNIFDPEPEKVDLKEEFGDLLDTHAVPTVPYLGDTGEIIVPEGAEAPKAKTVKVKKPLEFPPLPERMDEIAAGRPYLISVDEFMTSNEEYDKTTITYFEGDDTLCDEREEIVPDVEGVITADALTRFGQLSNDRNIVYVRNDKISTDFEVIRDRRNWHEVVAGYVAPKDKDTPRKMREDD